MYQLGFTCFLKDSSYAFKKTVMFLIQTQIFREKYLIGIIFITLTFFQL
jgi:hypothetical protein